MEVSDYEAKKIAVLGFGDEGKSAYKFFNEVGASVDVFDEHSSNKHPNNTTVSNAEAWELDEYDFVVRSPGLSPHKLKTTAKITSVTQLFFELCPAPIIGVTGTKGKGTTSTLIANILRQTGQKTHLLGNIGKPALDVLGEIGSDDLVVYELSSFQLWDMNKSPHLGVVLMVEPEHLDVHEDLDDYLDAKANISKHQSTNDVTIMHPFNELSEKVAMNGAGIKKKFMALETARIKLGELLVGDTNIMPVAEFGLVGPHNRENICAAVSAVWEYTQNVEAIKKAVTDFKGLEHRLEFVREVDGVRYFNDSFATTPGATIAAINSFDEPEVLILGGSDKQADYTDLAEAITVRNNIRGVILIGEMGAKIEDALKSFDYHKAVKVEGDINAIVSKASELAKDGDVVLLSPACASFGMFDNYKQRGKLFKQAVADL